MPTLMPTLYTAYRSSLPSYVAPVTNLYAVAPLPPAPAPSDSAAHFSSVAPAHSGLTINDILNSQNADGSWSDDSLASNILAECNCQPNFDI